MVVGIGEILTFNRKCTIFVGLLFAVIFITLIMVPSQADDDDSVNKVSNQIVVDAVNPENTIGAQSDTYFDKVNQLLTVRHVNRGGVLNIELSSSQDLTKPVITDFKVEPNTSVSINNPAIASANVEDENLYYIDFEFIDWNNLLDTDKMLLWYHINDTYFSPPWYANAWNITNGTVDDIVTTITDADWPDNIIIMGNFTQNATSEEEEALLWFNISTGNLNNVTRDDTVLTPLTIESGVSTLKVFNIKFDISEDFEEGPTFTLYTIEHENNPYLDSTHVPTGTYEVGVIAEDNNSKNCSDWTEIEVDSIWPIINSVTLSTNTPNAGDDILITVNATDNVAVTSVEANGIALTPQGGDIWNGSITAQPDYHIIYIKAIDAAGLIVWNHSLGYFANNTPIGTNVQVEIPEIRATITFTNVIKSGHTYISEFNDDPSPPTGYNVLSNYYDIVTTAEYSGDITICMDYDDSEAVDEDKMKILHYEEMEDETEIFALMQENISEGYTVWDLNGTTYPDVLCEGSSESLHFVIDGTGLEIIESNFVYNTSIYDENGEPFIAWLDEPMFVIESWGDWYLAKMLINDTHEDTYSLMVDNTMHLLEGYAITLIEIDVDGEEAWIVITKDGEEAESQVVRKGDQFIYEEDLNESGVDDNWVLRFYLENVYLDSNSIKINKTQLISPNLTIISTPDDVTISNFSIDSINGNTLGIRLDASDDIISLEKGGVVNLIGDKFRFKLDENGDTGGVLKRPDVTGLWQDVTSSLDTDTNIICGVVTNLSDFVIAIDNTPPAVSNVTVQPDIINISSYTNITAEVSGPDVYSVSVMITYPNGTYLSIDMYNNSHVYYRNFSNTTDPGRYNVKIIANDTTGNANDTQKTSFIVAHVYTNTAIKTNAGNSTFINASGTNITLELFTNDSITGSINITRSIVNITDELEVPGPGIYIRINASTNFSDDNYSNLSWALIKVNYTDEDVSNNNLVESSLRLYWYNKSSGNWTELKTNSPTWVYGSGVNTTKNYVWANVSHFSDYALGGALETPPPSNGDGDGGGGSSGGGSSGEDYYNIVLSETDRQSVYKNSHTSYRFDLEGNIVKHINFTALKSAGTVAAKVEILNNTSTLVSTPPTHEVFRNLNIWVGNAGWATKRNIADVTVVFTVEKSWITKNNIDESSIALYRYSDDTWHKLVTKKIAEDANSLQFEAGTPGFSAFAVTGKTIGEPGGEGIVEPTVTAEETPAPTPTEKKGIPGFSLFAGLSVLMIAVQLLRKKN